MSSPVATKFDAVEAIADTDLASIRWVAILVSRVRFQGNHFLLVLGIDGEGFKRPIGLTGCDGGDVSGAVSRLLSEFSDRGLSFEVPRLFVVSGSDILRHMIHDVGSRCFVQQCQMDTVQRVGDRMPLGAERNDVTRHLRDSYSEVSAARARSRLWGVIHDIQDVHVGATHLLRDHLEDSVAVMELGLSRSLAATLRSAETIRSLMAVCRYYAQPRQLVSSMRGYPHGDPASQFAAVVLTAARQFRRIKGFSHLHELIEALDSGSVSNRSR